MDELSQRQADGLLWLSGSTVLVALVGFRSRARTKRKIGLPLPLVSSRVVPSVRLPLAKASGRAEE